MDSSLQECFISLIAPNFLVQQMLHCSVYGILWNTKHFGGTLKGIKDSKQHWKVTRNYNAIISIANQCLTVFSKRIKAISVPLHTGLQDWLFVNNLLHFWAALFIALIISSSILSEENIHMFQETCKFLELVWYVWCSIVAKCTMITTNKAQLSGW